MKMATCWVCRRHKPRKKMASDPQDGWGCIDGQCHVVNFKASLRRWLCRVRPFPAHLTRPRVRMRLAAPKWREVYR